MSKLRTLASKFNNINIDNEIDNSIIGTSDIMVELNRQQLMNAEDAKGRAMPPYSAVSISVYGKEGNWTLEDSGDFYRGFIPNIKKDSIEIKSTDYKNSMLKFKTEKRGKDIFGLNDSNLTNYSRNTILPRLQSNIKNYLKV